MIDHPGFSARLPAGRVVSGMEKRASGVVLGFMGRRSMFAAQDHCPEFEI
jgi:hypothetical protein